MDPVTIGSFDVAVRVLAAGALGALIGLERERRSQAAGLRTHTLVAAGAALFTLAGAYGFGEIPRSANVDPMRVAAQVASGIGFVGAGAILRDGMSVRGLTTAATLWASAAVGVAAGAGFYEGAVVGLGAVLVTLVALRFVRDAALRAFGAEPSVVDVEVVYQRGRGTLAEVLEAVQRGGSSVVGVSVDDEGERSQAGIRRAILQARTDDPPSLEHSMSCLVDLPEVRSVRVRPAQGVAVPETAG